ncbi:hypothetical protein [uncultured Wocania sp.]|uniref:hypothetical protein n=1 Tax=uncultured Wocania sp. TaxID=2834404 RepID=UPI0030F9D9E3
MEIRSLIIIFLTLNLISFGQEPDSKDCYEIKYLDFFGLDQMEIIKWPQSELDGLMKMDFAKDRGQSKIKTNFIIPMIVYQLKEYHPNCYAKIDTTYFNKISDLYLKIRDIDSIKLLNKSIIEKINFIRADFYSQVENVDYLPKMTATFDDGPFYGVDFEQKLELKPIKIQETEFGTLNVSKVKEKIILTGKNKKGAIIWQKAITGLSDRSLTELHFIENPMEYNSVATVAHMYSEGERFTLYLKNDGSFMYYFHSW